MPKYKFPSYFWIIWAVSSVGLQLILVLKQDHWVIIITLYYTGEEGEKKKGKEGWGWEGRKKGREGGRKREERKEKRARYKKERGGNEEFIIPSFIRFYPYRCDINKLHSIRYVQHYSNLQYTLLMGFLFNLSNFIIRKFHRLLTPLREDNDSLTVSVTNSTYKII